MPGDPYFAAPPQQSFASALHEPGKPLRVGIMREAPRGIDVHPEMVEAVERCALRLEALGHEVEDSRPDALADPTSVVHYVITVQANVARALDAWGEKVGRVVEQSDVEPLTWELASRGREISAPQLLATVEAVHRFGRQLAEWWRGGFDLLLTPTQAAPPPRIGTLGSTPEEPLRGFVGSAPYGVFTLPFNLSGQPAISLPGGWTAGDEKTPAGLPLGIQLVAPYGAERLLLRAAAELEQAEPWADRLPPLFG
jgi:amidase